MEYRSLAILAILILTTAAQFLHAQREIQILSGDITLYGTLLEPDRETENAILIISGSGNTDRDGNTLPIYKNDAIKILAKELTALGYATLRYDKRGVGRSINDLIGAETLRFEQYVNDAANWITYLDEHYDNVTVIGHSQGALVGMMAIQLAPADRFVSLAGLAEDAYTTVRRQLSSQPQFITDAAYPILDSLRNGVTVDSVPPLLLSLFDPRIQDYFISFMRYDPMEEITQLRIPALVIQGTTDLQITVDEARALSEKAIFVRLEIIDSMNHVLREVSSDQSANMATYSNADLPLHPKLVPAIASFLKENPWYLPLVEFPGTWQVNDKQAFEEWTFEDGIFAGSSYKVKNGIKSVSETLTIENKPDGIVYTATVLDQNEGKGIPFTLNQDIGELISFENPGHDFPNKIQYKLVDSEEMTVDVLGKDGQGFTITMKRLKP